MEYLNNVSVNVMPWPAHSPDLLPIQHLWDIMKTPLDRCGNKPQSRAKLFAAVQENGNNPTVLNTIKILRGIFDKNAECYQDPVMYCIIQSISVLSKPLMND